MRAWLIRLLAAYGRLPVAVRVEIVIVLVLAGSAGVLSWDALRWGAGQLGIDLNLTWLYPVVIDGTMLGATVGLLALVDARHRVYMWVLLFAGLSASVLGNGAHSSGGPEIIGPITLHRLGSAAPALGLATMLHTLLLLVRQGTGARRGAVRDASEMIGGKSARARPRRTAKARIAALLDTDPPPATKEIARKLGVSQGHVRKARAQVRRSAA